MHGKLIKPDRTRKESSYNVFGAKLDLSRLSKNFIEACVYIKISLHRHKCYEAVKKCTHLKILVTHT